MAATIRAKVAKALSVQGLEWQPPASKSRGPEPASFLTQSAGSPKLAVQMP